MLQLLFCGMFVSGSDAKTPRIKMVSYRLRTSHSCRWTVTELCLSTSTSLFGHANRVTCHAVRATVVLLDDVWSARKYPCVSKFSVHVCGAKDVWGFLPTDLDPSVMDLWCVSQTVWFVCVEVTLNYVPGVCVEFFFFFFFLFFSSSSSSKLYNFIYWQF